MSNQTGCQRFGNVNTARCLRRVPAGRSLPLQTSKNKDHREEGRLLIWKTNGEHGWRDDSCQSDERYDQVGLQCFCWRRSPEGKWVGVAAVNQTCFLLLAGLWFSSRRHQLPAKLKVNYRNSIFCETQPNVYEICRKMRKKLKLSYTAEYK